MADTWVDILVRDVAAPTLGALLIDLIRQKNGNWPTEAEYKAAVAAKRKVLIAEGEVFLRETDPTSAPPGS